MQLEVGETDPISLEPCDKKKRPFRLSKNINKPEIIKQKENQTEFIFSYVYRNNLDYKDHFNPRQHAEVSNEEWEDYQCYLDFLIDNKEEISKFLESDSDMKGHFIFEIFMLAYEYSRIKTGRKMRNIWNYFKTESIGSYSNYFRDNENKEKIDLADCKQIFS